MKKEESQSSSANEGKDIVSDALRKFRRKLTSTFPLKRICDFYDERKIREFARNEEENLVRTIVLSRTQKDKDTPFLRSWRDLELGIEKAVKDLIKKNQCSLKKYQTVIFDGCDGYKMSLKMQRTLDHQTQVELDKFRKLVEDEKIEALNSLPDQWEHKICQSMPPQQLKMKPSQIQSSMKQGNLGEVSSGPEPSTDPVVHEVHGCSTFPGEERLKFRELKRNLTKKTDSPAPSSDLGSSNATVTPTPVVDEAFKASDEHLKFTELKRWVSKKVVEIKGDKCPNFPPFQNLGLYYPNYKTELQNTLKEMKSYVEATYNNFSKDEYRQVYLKLLELLTIASEVLAHSYTEPGYTKGSLKEENFAAWIQAFELDTECLSSRLPLNYGVGLRRHACVIGLTNTKMFEYETSLAGFEWTDEDFKRINSEVNVMETELISLKQGHILEPEMMLKKLRRILIMDVEIRKRALNANKPNPSPKRQSQN